MEQENITPNQSIESVEALPQPKSTSPVESPKKTNKKAIIVCLSILSIISIITAAIFAALYFTQPSPSNPSNGQVTNDSSNETQNTDNTEEIAKTYQLSNYVNFSKQAIPVSFPEEVAVGHVEDIVKVIELKNLPQDTIIKFDEAQKELVELSGSPIYSRKNSVGASLNNNILSVHTTFYYYGIYGDSDLGKALSLNYDLETNSEISNENLMKLYGTTSDEVYEVVLRELVHNVETNNFLLNTNGDTSGPSISVVDFTKNIPEYKTTLSAKPDIINLYVDGNNQIHVLYEQYVVLENLGMSTHMGAGLISGMQDITL